MTAEETMEHIDAFKAMRDEACCDEHRQIAIRWLSYYTDLVHAQLLGVNDG